MLWLAFAVRLVAPQEHGVGVCCEAIRGDVPGADDGLFGFGRRERAQPRTSLVEARGGCLVATLFRRQSGWWQPVFGVFRSSVRRVSMRRPECWLRLVFRRDTRASRGRATSKGDSLRVERRCWLFLGRLVRSGALAETPKVAGFGPKHERSGAYDLGLSFVVAHVC